MNKRFEHAFQVAAVSTMVSLILAVLVSFLAGVLPNHLFSSGGLSLAPQTTAGIYNTDLLGGIAVLLIFFIIYLLPTLFPKVANPSRLGRIFVYTLAVVIALVVSADVLLLPVVTGHIPALQRHYFLTILSLTTIAAYLFCMQPSVAQRSQRSRLPKSDKT